MKELICTVCPRGCKLTIDENQKVSGNLCARGIPYAKSETTNPVRFLTTTVVINGALIKRLPVRTSKSIPKNRIFEVLDILKSISIAAPVECGQIIIKNALDLEVDIISMRTIEKN